MNVILHCRRSIAAIALAAAAGGCASVDVMPANPDELAAQLARHPVAILGETHDNAAQHRLRATALARLYEGGARPALALEQFDRGQQAAIDALLQADAPVAERVDRIVALGDRGWNWTYYRPYVELAVTYRVPLIAANLSRADALRVARDGVGAAFGPAEQAAMRLQDVPADLLRAQRREVDEGHCHTLPADALEPMARAQVARDATMAAMLQPVLPRGVVLLAGNGHARRDIGVVRYLSPADRQRAVSIGLIEDDGHAPELPRGAFDAIILTAAQPRPDPCLELQKKAG